MKYKVTIEAEIEFYDMVKAMTAIKRVLDRAPYHFMYSNREDPRIVSGPRVVRVEELNDGKF
jgi:hypothetical protein